jgi:hypothetical protein
VELLYIPVTTSILPYSTLPYPTLYVASAWHACVGLSRDIVERMPPLEQWRNFVYCVTMLGDILGRVDHFKVCDEEGGGGMVQSFLPWPLPVPGVRVGLGQTLPATH